MKTTRLLLVMLAAVAALSVGETLIARGMRQAGDASNGWWAVLKMALSSGWVIAGGLLLAIHLGLYATALSIADLSLVMPLTAASYPLGVLLARFFLHEEVNLARWLGTAVITLGVAVVAWSEAKP
jgi:bacterial/archaeal transporter family protein